MCITALTYSPPVHCKQRQIEQQVPLYWSSLSPMHVCMIPPVTCSNGRNTHSWCYPSGFRGQHAKTSCLSPSTKVIQDRAPGSWQSFCRLVKLLRLPAVTADKLPDARSKRSNHTCSVASSMHMSCLQGHPDQG